MDCSKTQSTSSFELDLEFVLEQIQYGMDAAKEEVQQDMEKYWEVVKA